MRPRGLQLCMAIIKKDRNGSNSVCTGLFLSYKFVCVMLDATLKLLTVICLNKGPEYNIPT